MRWQKLATTVGLVIIVGVVALQQASARGWGGGPGGGYDCPWSGQPYYQMNEADRTKMQEFRDNTVDLRRQIAMKRAEKMALMRHQNPDPASIAKVEGELFDLRTEMQNKARETGVPVMGGFRGKGGYPGMRAAGMGRQGQQMIDCPYRQQLW
ncbi:MAG: periplasmic heavy metal sensor [Desulfocapsaceae bacterium]|nr:periplasmic heavy metal sensor [Desulfocapsaceae bacterium]